jgi:hypothetical protein
MNRMKIKLLLLSVITALLFISCNSHHVINEPDYGRFNKTVHSEVLQDSLNMGVITSGMPYFVVSQMFEGWPQNNVKIPVATLGSKQRLEESEGWSRKYTDPNHQIFLDEYKTDKGELKVWYQYPDFYRMEVSMGDTLCIFFEDSIICSTIKYLNKSLTLTVRDSLTQLPAGENLYGEIRYKDHGWRKVSHWYTLQMLGNFRTFRLKDLNYEIYPIELLEFEDEPVTSFKWR